MTYENVKSLILTILVLVSLGLTWNIWTYQPAYEYSQSEELMEDVPIKEKQDIGELIKPIQMLFHYEGTHYGTVDHQEINRFSKEMKKWSLYDFKPISSLIAKEDFTTFMHGKGRIEVVFPDTVPLQSLRSLLSTNEEFVPDVAIDRVLIDMENKDDVPSIYLVNYHDRTIYSAKANNLSLSSIDRSFYKPSVRYSAHRFIPITDSKYIFVQSGRVQLNKVHYIADYYAPENFKNALFSDPSRVTKDQMSMGEVYTDGYKLMTIDQHYARLQFANPVNADLLNSLDFNVVEESITFVNEHSGWTDKYLFAEWDKTYRDHTAVFRLYMNNYPVFNSQGLSEIVQIWRNNEIYEYSRPIFELKWPIRSEQIQVTLPTAETVLRELEALHNFNKEELQNIKVGYELKRDLTNEGVFILEPIWVYQYKNSWNKVIFQQQEDLGGM